MLPAFRDKPLNARKKAVLRFTKRVGLSYRVATHTAQKNFQETKEESRHFIEFIKDKVSMKDPADIINMDQTPIPFLFHAGRTLERKGSRTIHICMSTVDTKQVRLTVTVDASGQMMPPFLVFKGAANAASPPSSNHIQIAVIMPARRRRGWTRRS